MNRVFTTDLSYALRPLGARCFGKKYKRVRKEWIPWDKRKKEDRPYSRPHIYLANSPRARLLRPDYSAKIAGDADFRPGPWVNLLRINYFETLGLPVDYKVDLQALENKYSEKVSAVESLEPECGEWEQKRRENLLRRYKRSYDSLLDPQSRAEHFMKLNNIDPPKSDELDYNHNYLKIQLDTTRKLKEFRSPSEWKSFHKRTSKLLETYIGALSNCFETGTWSRAHRCLLHVQILRKVIQLTEDLAKHPEMQPIKPDWYLKPYMKEMIDIQNRLWEQSYNIRLPENFEGPVAFTSD